MIDQLREYIVSKTHHQYRNDYPEYENLCEQYKAERLSPKERMTRRFELMIRLEKPVLLPNEKIAYIRTVKSILDCFTQEEYVWKRSLFLALPVFLTFQMDM